MKPYVEGPGFPTSLGTETTSSHTFKTSEWSTTASTAIGSRRASTIQECPTLPDKPSQSTTAIVKDPPGHSNEEDPVIRSRAQMVYQLGCLLNSLECASPERTDNYVEVPPQWRTFRPFLEAVKQNSLLFDLVPLPFLIDRLKTRAMDHLVSLCQQADNYKPAAVVVEQYQLTSKAGQRLKYRATLINGRLFHGRQKLEAQIGT
jgi:hypothetical protein